MKAARNIEPLEGGSFRVTLQSKACSFRKTFKTLDEAIRARNAFEADHVDVRQLGGHDASIHDRLLVLFVLDPGPGCWLYTGRIGGNGYGRFKINNRAQHAHRISYETFVGPIPEGLFVCHRCDTPRCIRPEHLFLGTPLDNMRDMVQKGRARTGPRGTRAKLSLDAADEIRAMRAAGASCEAIASKYGVRALTVRRVLSGRVWARTA